MYVPGQVVKTFKSGEAGTFKGEDGKVRPSVRCARARPHCS